MRIEKLVKEINSSEEYKNFLNRKEEARKKGFDLDQKYAIFKDQKGDFHIVEIYINMGQCFMLKSRNQYGENTRIYEYIFQS